MQQEYLDMLFKIDDAFDKNQNIQIRWANGLHILCKSITGVYETDTEPGDEDYIGEYAAGVEIVEILHPGTDDDKLIFYNSIEICLNCIPEQILSEDGAVLWERKSI